MLRSRVLCAGEASGAVGVEPGERVQPRLELLRARETCVDDLAHAERRRLRGGQARPSFSYGTPSAAGGIERPTTPARMTIVTRYGSAAYQKVGIDFRI